MGRGTAETAEGGEVSNTPGPWVQVDSEYANQEIWATVTTATGREQGYHVCTLCTGDEMQANGQLIAAAPDLLEACEELICSLGLDADYKGPRWQAAVQSMHKAIARAKGDQRRCFVLTVTTARWLSEIAISGNATAAEEHMLSRPSQRNRGNQRKRK